MRNAIEWNHLNPFIYISGEARCCCSCEKDNGPVSGSTRPLDKRQKTRLYRVSLDLKKETFPNTSEDIHLFKICALFYFALFRLTTDS